MRPKDVIGFVLALALATGSLAAGAPKRAQELGALPMPVRCFGNKLARTVSIDVEIGPPACPIEPPIEIGAGSLSVGSPTRGSLHGGAVLSPGDGLVLEGAYHWGTELAVRSLERAVRQVRACHPGSPDLHIGDLSREHGGWLRPHRSHQSGLDADVGYYYLDDSGWYQHATAKNLDRRRTWALIRALVDGGAVDMIFIDRSVQEILRAYVRAEDPEGLRLFQPKNKPREGVIRHAWGHATHMHVRFSDPASVERGAKVGPTIAIRR